MGGLTVVPTIRRNGNQLEVVLSIDVGSGRTGTEEVIDGTDVDLEVIDESGRRWEVVSRPAQGPLEVDGSRALYANATFSFHAPAQERPQRLRVGLRGARAEIAT